MKKTITCIIVISNILTTLGQHFKQNTKDYIWDLSSLYANDNEWTNDKVFIIKNVKKISEIPDSVSSDKELSTILDFVSDLRSRSAKMVVYSALLSNLDYTSEQAQQKYDTATQLEDLVESHVFKVEQLLTDIPKEKLNNWLNNSQSLQVHKKRINRVLEQEPYLLNSEAEKVLRSLNRMRQFPGETYTSFMDSKIGWPACTLQDGTEIILTPSNYSKYKNSKVEEDRNKVITTFLNFLGSNSNLLGNLLVSRIATDLQIAKLRGFVSGADAQFFMRDGFAVGGHNVLLNAVRQNKNALQRFIKVRASLLKQERINYEQLHSNPFSSNDTFSLKESINIIKNATAFLGEDYQSKLIGVLSDSTFHLVQTTNKRNMWAIYPPVGGAKPYTIMSYNDSFLASNVLARALVGNLAQHHYSPDTRDDPPVYNNGVIYVGSLLHYDYLIHSSADKNKKLYYLVEEANRLWKSFFRYLIFAELEHYIEASINNNFIPNGETISNKYYSIITSYYGTEYVEIPNEYKYEWLTFQQPFHTIEHQYWPPAIATACSILEKVAKGNDNALNLLLGKVTEESDRSYQILKAAKIDLLDIETYNPLINRMNRLLDEIELVIAHKE